MKPKIFVGSSSESLRIAEAVQSNLQHDAQVTLWSQGVFVLSSTTLDDLIKVLDESDFGIFVLTPDDLSTIRNHQFTVTRDNVIFEFGLFIGRLGKGRVFFLLPQSQQEHYHLPTDLLGAKPGMYDDARSDGNVVAAVGPFCSDVRAILKEFISDTYHGLRNESKAARNIALTKPRYWEWLLAAELLESKLIAVNKRYNELEAGYFFSASTLYTQVEYGRLLEELLTDYEALWKMLNILITKNLKDSFGPDGVPGNSADIAIAVERIVSFCNELLAWEYRLRKASPPPHLSITKEKMIGWSNYIFQVINALPSEIKRVVHGLQFGFKDGERKTLDLRLEFPKEKGDELVILYRSALGIA